MKEREKRERRERRGKEEKEERQRNEEEAREKNACSFFSSFLPLYPFPEEFPSVFCVSESRRTCLSRKKKQGERSSLTERKERKWRANLNDEKNRKLKKKQQPLSLPFPLLLSYLLPSAAQGRIDSSFASASRALPICFSCVSVAPGFRGFSSFSFRFMARSQEG